MTCSGSDRQERRAGGHLLSRDVTEEQEPQREDRGERVKQERQRKHNLITTTTTKIGNGGKEVVKKKCIKNTSNMFFN